MIEVISDTKHVAQKDYKDDSAEFIIECMYSIRSGLLTFSELRAIARLKANGWKIKKGQVYMKQFNKMDGDTYTFRSLPEIAAICHKYELYPEY